MIPQVRISPEGYAAQRFPQDFNGHGHWLLTYWQEGVGVAVKALDDVAVADWPEPQSAEVERLREHILDIDAHATPFGDVPDDPGWVGTYLVTAGALHRALGKIGRSAPSCTSEAELRAAPPPCCKLHGRSCEHGEYCCRFCVEVEHPGHASGTICSKPDLSARVREPSAEVPRGLDPQQPQRLRPLDHDAHAKG